MYKNTHNIKKNSALQCSSKEGSKRLNDNSDERRRSESFLYKHTIMTHNNAFTIIYIYFCLLFSSVLLVSSLNCDLHCIHSNTLCYWHH